MAFCLGGERNVRDEVLIITMFQLLVVHENHQGWLQHALLWRLNVMTLNKLFMHNFVFVIKTCPVNATYGDIGSKSCAALANNYSIFRSLKYIQNTLKSAL